MQKHESPRTELYINNAPADRLKFSIGSVTRTKMAMTTPRCSKLSKQTQRCIVSDIASTQIHIATLAGSVVEGDSANSTALRLLELL